ncbi:ATP-dependent endonuclease [Arthrobacter gandavensis]|uniref:TOPRIM nucleotidyl transferase/hydrolase domain-containing protein n=1 Tax=Arthrobacter gandavensis TaxID=169960 RepID=UPI00188E443B|nr:TOPRIM nucleotidyl transferase/hydrolase domain-containing protein [Arthrobacter gandavensis]MBF4994375.1 ATP-dependent endonuclease [Arthrobacter gandavensis]
MRATTVLVEGESDRLALQVLAGHSGLDPAAENITVVPMGGVTNIARFLARYGPDGAGHRLLGLCDEAEAWYVRRALDRAGIGSGDLPGRGFQVCRTDLEDELIRALGAGVVVDIIAAEGELGSFRLLQRQPSLRKLTVEEQLHRFLAGRSGNKIRYAPLLVGALAPADVPDPLARLAAACRSAED